MTCQYNEIVLSVVSLSYLNENYKQTYHNYRLVQCGCEPSFIPYPSLVLSMHTRIDSDKSVTPLCRVPHFFAKSRG